MPNVNCPSDAIYFGAYVNFEYFVILLDTLEGVIFVIYFAIFRLQDFDTVPL